MGTRPFHELLPLYAREEITPEQTLGYILQNLVEMEKSMEELRREYAALKEAYERLKAFVGMEEESTSKKNDKRRDEVQGEEKV
jgi:hypothetical protein